MFNTPLKTFQLPVYANAIAHQSLTSTSSSLMDDYELENVGVLKYLDISATEEKEHSGGTSEQASSASYLS